MFKSFLFAALLGVMSLAHAEEPKPEPSQYQALANTANEVLTKAIEVATTGGQFLEKQLPLVVQELILWNTVIGFFWATIFLLTPFELASDFGTNEDGDEEGVGNWMMGWHRECLIKERIACPEIGYPASEALYATIKEWEAATGKVWVDEYSP